MLITDLALIGTRLHEIRKSRKLSQAEVATAANISCRAYADIERGASNMRVETMLRICTVLDITPDTLFVTERSPAMIHQKEILHKLSSYSAEDRESAHDLLSTIIKML